MAKFRLPTEAEIWSFALQVPIATKDFGVQPIEGWGTQRVLIRKILQGKSQGINQFVVVKARQVGASTIMLLLTLFWMWRHAGLQGLTVTDGEENKQYFRDLFLMMIEELEQRQASSEKPNMLSKARVTRPKANQATSRPSRLYQKRAAAVLIGMIRKRSTSWTPWPPGARSTRLITSANRTARNASR